MISQPLSTFIFTILAGGLAQLLAVWLSLPSIVFLLLFGMLLGPGLVGWVDPAQIANLPIYIELMVAVILFTGGMSLHLGEMRAHGRMVLRLLTVGLVTTFVLTSLATGLVLNVRWTIAILFGALMVVTGPTVILPLLKRVPLKKNLYSILKWEGMLIDPLGVILTVLVLEVILAEERSFGPSVSLFAARLLVGGGIGLATGFVTAAALRRRLFLGHDVEELGGLASVAVALFSYGVCESIYEESGLVCVTVAGIVLGNARFPYKLRITAFKQQVATGVLSVLFILLAANVRIDRLLEVANPGLLLVALMMFAIRPASVFVSGVGTSLTVREKLMLALTAPRGVVAASFAFLLSQILVREGRAEAEVMVPLAFLVICTTVLFSGLLGRPTARALGVYEGERRGLLIVGANALGRLVAGALASRGVPVKLVDKSPREVTRARNEGFEAHLGDATNAVFLETIEMNGVGKVLALTPNQEVNILACAAAARFVGDDEVFRLDDRRDPWPAERVDAESWGRPLADVTATPGELDEAARRGRLAAEWDGSAPAGAGERWPLLGLTDGDRVVFTEEPRSSHGGWRPADGARVLYIIRESA